MEHTAVECMDHHRCFTTATQT